MELYSTRSTTGNAIARADSPAPGANLPVPSAPLSGNHFQVLAQVRKGALSAHAGQLNAAADSKGPRPLDTENYLYSTPFTVLAAQPAPTNLVAIPGNQCVTLSWNASPNASQYTVYISLSPTGPFNNAILTTSATSCVIGPSTDGWQIANGTTYYFVVTATYNSGGLTGTSADSNVASATPEPPAAGGTGLTATPGNAQVTLNWPAVTGATGYNVYYSTDSSGTSYTQFANNVQNTMEVVHPLNNGTTYYFVFTWIDSAGEESQYSNQASATPMAPPPAPTNLQAYPGNTCVNLTWQPAATASSYAVLMSQTSGGQYQQVATASATTCTVGNLQNGTTYYFVVQGVNVGGNGPSSNQAQATPYAGRIPIGIVPNPPTGYLPDALALPEWEDQAIPKDSSDSPGGGPSSIFSVSEPFGELDASSGPDIVMDDPFVGRIAFSREYRTALAAGNISSPGLPPGWTHNFDYRIYPQQSGSWGSMQLVYPNGASETLTPVVQYLPGTNVGMPTGAFNVPSFAPYVANGVPGSTIGVWTSITLSRNGLEKEVFAIPPGDSVYRLTAVVNDVGAQTNFTYADGQLTQISSVSPTGASTTKSISLAYSGGLLSSVSASGSGSVDYNYSGGELASVTNVDGGAVLWSYGYTTLNQAPYLSSASTEGSSGTANVTYNSQTGQVSTLTDARGNVHNYTYSGLPVGGPSGTTTVQIGAGFDSRKDTYDSLGRLSTAANARGDTSSYAWWGGEILNAFMPNGFGYVTTRDSMGNPTQIVDPAGCTETLTWAYSSTYPFGQLTQTQVAGSQGAKMPATTYQYYAATNTAAGQLAGYLSSVTEPTGQVFTYTYSPLGQVQTVTTTASDGSSVTTNVGYGQTGGEVLGEPTSITDPLNLKTQISYNGDLESTLTDPLSYATTVQVNGNRQPVTIATPDGTTTSLNYVAPGKALASATASSTSGSQQLFSLGFDSEFGDTGKQADPLQTVTTANDTEYDLASLLNGNGVQMHTFNWDPFTQTETYTNGAGGAAPPETFTSQLYASNSAGQVSGPGYTGTFQLTPSYGPSVLTYTATSSLAQGYGEYYYYDQFNRVTSASSDSGGGHAYTYDSFGRVLTDTALNDSIAYTYGPDGSRSTMTLNLDGVTYNYTYTYDHDGRVTCISVNNPWQTPGTPSTISVTYSYDKDGRVTEVQSPGVWTFYSYDAGGRVTQIENLTPAGDVDDSSSQITGPDNLQHSVFSVFGGAGSLTSPMAYDVNSNLLGFSYSIRQSLGNYWTGGISYTFAGASAIASENWTGSVKWSTNYGRDAAENLTSMRGETFSTDPGSDELLSSTNTFKNGIQYDVQGNETSFRGLTAAFFVDGSMESLNGSTFTYDNDGRLQYDSSKGGQYVYDGDELVGQGTSAYIWGPTGPVAEIDGSEGVQYYTFDPNGSLVSRIAPEYNAETSQLYAFGNDGPVLFDAYGLPENGNENSPGTWGAVGSIYCPFQYKGQAGYVSRESNGTGVTPTLISCENRWYDPMSGRWISRDPTGLDGGENLYEFCDSNPLMLVDPDGMQSYPWQNQFNPTSIWENLARYFGSSSFSSNEQMGQHFWTVEMPRAANRVRHQYGPAVELGMDVGFLIAGDPEVAATDLTLEAAEEATPEGAELLARVTSRLEELIPKAKAAARLTRPQLQAAAKDPGLTKMFMGQRYDAELKLLVGRDPFLQKVGLRMPTKGALRPDFYLPKMDVWWDLTTPEQWASHVAKYGRRGIFLGYH